MTVDCTQAGDGQLRVEIMHNGRPVTCRLERDSGGIYRSHFTPSGPGIYTIRVYFADMEVSGVYSVTLFFIFGKIILFINKKKDFFSRKIKYFFPKIKNKNSGHGTH